MKIGEQTGHVLALWFRTTHIKTFDEKDVFIPNAKIIKETLVNLTKDGIIRLDFLVGIAYEDNIAKALETMVKVTEQVEGVMKGKKPFTVVEDFTTNTINIRVFFWSETDDYKKGVLITKSQVIKNVVQSLFEQGFTMPANIQELKLYEKQTSLPLESFQPHRIH